MVSLIFEKNGLLHFPTSPLLMTKFGLGVVRYNKRSNSVSIRIFILLIR